MNIVKFFFFTLILNVLLATGFQNPANANSNKNATKCAVVEDLILFVAKENGYPPLRICPRISVTTDAVLSSMFEKASIHGEEPLAAFLHTRSEILLSPDVDITTPIGRSYLVHEIVHAYQFANQLSANASCLGLLELEAYRAQARYLRTHDLEKEALQFELTGMMQGSCASFYGE